MVDWAPLSVEIPTQPVLVFTAESLDDRGEQDPNAEGGGADTDLPHVVRFTEAKVLAGKLDDPMDVLAGRYDVIDAQAELADGAKLLVWSRPLMEGETDRWATLVALESDGDIAFLGDCHPTWTPAFAQFAEDANTDLTPTELLTEIVTKPSGNEAKAFSRSPSSRALAGPTNP